MSARLVQQNAQVMSLKKKKKEMGRGRGSEGKGSVKTLKRELTEFSVDPCVQGVKLHEPMRA